MRAAAGCWKHAVLLVALLVSACSATVVVPPETVKVPARAAVVDHGRHSTLLLERADGSMVRYAYGQWEWYAEGKTGPARALGALFLPGEGALGRKYLPGPLSAENARRQVREGLEEVLVFHVERERSEALQARLDVLFRSGEARLLHHPGFDLDFVPIPISYWLGNNSNLVMAEWLEALGCRVDNPGALSNWRLG